MTEHSIDALNPGSKPAESSTGGRHDPFWDASGLTDFYCNAFDVIGVVAMIVDLRGAIRMFNRKAVELTGFTRESVLGKDAFTLLFPAGLQDLARSSLLYDVQDAGETTYVRISSLTRDGRILLLDWDSSIVRDDSGAIFGTICIGHLVPEARYPADECNTIRNAACSCSNDLMHDILNYNQVAVGYLEMAIDQCDQAKELQSLLSNVHKALMRGSNLALDAYRSSRNAPYHCDYAIRAGLKAGNKKGSG